MKLTCGLFDWISGEDGFLMRLRTENRFPEELYQPVIQRIRASVCQWQDCGTVPTGDFLAICYLAAETAGGNRFLAEEDALRLEDVGLELMEILSALEPFSQKK